MNFRTEICFLCAALLVSVSNLCAQVYPVQANIQIQPPYSPYLTDYTTPGSQKLILQLRANDITISDHPIKLRITIEGLGITIRTKQNFIPQPLTLAGGGAPTILYGEDLHEYFNPNNLDFAGLSKKEFSQTGKLPEGVYRFSVEVLSYNRNVQLSNKAFTMAWIILNDPPLLNLPRKDTKITILDPTNIAFTWTPRHTGSPNSAFTTEYNFKLVEIWPADRNPNNAFLSQPALYEITTTRSQIIYGLAEPALIPGRKYAWQVQAFDTEGRDLFKNQGRSEVYAFQFGDAIGTPENLRKEGGNASTLSLRWELPLTGDIPDQYRVRYKPDFNDNWYESVTSNRWATLGDLRENTTYDIQVRAEKARIFGEYTALQKHSTDVKKEDAFSCGEPANIQPTENTGMLLSLSPGDTFTCSDFKVTVTEITSATNGMFIGKGIMPVNMFNGAHVKVTFSGTINSNYQLITGSVKTVYEKGSQMAQVIDEMKKIGEKKQPKPDSTQQNPADAAITYIVDGIIDSVFVNEEGQIVVIDEEGNETTYEPNKDENGEVQPTIIADAGGNTYTVDKDGKVTKSSGSQDATASTGNTNSNVTPDPVKDRIIVLILEQFEEEIAAWLRINGKGGEDDPDVLLAEELPKCFPRDADILESINTNTIPYYLKKENTHELREKVEANADANEIFNKLTDMFTSADSLNWIKVPEEDQELSRAKLCEIILEEDERRNALLFANPVSWTELAGGCETCPTGWEDLISFKPSKSTWDEIMRRREQAIFNGPYNRWDILDIEKAKGSEINLDYYSIQIEKLPIFNGKQMTSAELFDHIRKNLHNFIDNSIAQFKSYSDRDREKWESSNPLNAVMTFHISGDLMGIPVGNIDDASVICSNYQEMRWIFSTIQNPKDVQHPVSGNRQFGIRLEGANLIFFTKGADRLTGFMDEQIGNPQAFIQADKLWKSMLLKVSEFVNSNSGQAKNDRIFSERFNWTK